MSVLLIGGSPTEHSRSTALLDAVAQRLREQVDGRRLPIDRLRMRDLSPQALLLADWGHASVARAVEQVANARALVIATPVYKAAYSGVLKVFLDLLPQTALKGKAVLQSLGARHILPGVYATDAQVPKDGDGQYHVEPEIAQRLDDAVQLLLHEGLRMPATAGFAPVPFAQVRCSV